MKSRLGFKLKAENNRFILKTASKTIVRGYMSMGFSDEYLGSSVMIYAYDSSTNGYSSYLYSEKSRQATKAIMRADEKKLTLRIGRYTITCKREADFKKLRRAMVKYRLIGDTGAGSWPRLKSKGTKKPHSKLSKKTVAKKTKTRR